MFFLIKRVFIGIPLKIRLLFHGLTISSEKYCVNKNIWQNIWLYCP
jgi:hypothetical protein